MPSQREKEKGNMFTIQYKIAAQRISKQLATNSKLWTLHSRWCKLDFQRRLCKAVVFVSYLAVQYAARVRIYMKIDTSL